MRIATAGFSHESNSFYSQPTQLEDFGVCEGADVISQYAGTFHEIAGYIAGAEEFGYELYPLLATSAMPGGPVTADTYEHFVGRILSGLEAAPKLDGVLLALHGAMVAEGFPQADGETVRRVRALVGDLPIAVTHDYHANVPPELVDAADSLIIYKTNPHIDQRERGLQAASILTRQIRGEVQPKMALVKPEVLFNIYFHNTSVAPMQPLMQAAIELESQAGILGCSIAGGYQYADVPYMGPAIVVIADGDEERARREAERLGEQMWASRDQLKHSVPDPAEAVRLALASEETPVCLLDMGDNIGGGSSGDSTFVLEQLLAQGRTAGLCRSGMSKARRRALPRASAGRFSFAWAARPTICTGRPWKSPVGCGRCTTGRTKSASAGTVGDAILIRGRLRLCKSNRPGAKGCSCSTASGLSQQHSPDYLCGDSARAPAHLGGQGCGGA